MELIYSLRSGRWTYSQLFFILPLWFLFLARADATVNQTDEVRALLTFRDANQVPYLRYWDTWNNSESNPCTWVGVTCASNSTVAELDFSGWGVYYVNLDALSGLRDLRRLDLSSNGGFEPGAVDSIGNLTQLNWLDLSRNSLAFPSTVSYCKNLRFLYLEETGIMGQLSEAISSNISDLVNLQFLNFASNLLHGSFSTNSLGGLSSLMSLDLSHNSLSGSIPSLPNLNAGDPLPPCTLSFPRRAQWWVLLLRWIKEEKLYLIIGGFAILGILGTGSFLFAVWQWKVYKKRHQQDADLIQTLLERESATLMPLRELKKATENFAASAQIGEGGFGVVYIGKLENGTMVAVKRSKHEGSEKDKEQFLNEVKILSQIKHRNLVKLLGCCMENKVAVLVFDFISNGTLQEHLRGKIGAVWLSWKQRLNIAIQTAEALHYLHSSTVFPIYHRDVKSANILLDDDLNAKVADFGISKLAPRQATHVSTVTIQGTIGYIDPEYYTSYKLTDKSDVYSFGVVLLELISAKPALDFLRGGDETSLVYFASPYIARGDLQGLIDPALTETYCDEAGEGRESIQNVGKLAMTCLEMRSKARPNMSEVLKELQQLWVDIYGTSNHTKYLTGENDNDDSLQGDHNVLLLKIPSEESSSFALESDESGIQLSQFLKQNTA